MREMTHPVRTAKKNHDPLIWADPKSDTWLMIDDDEFSAHWTRDGFRRMAAVASPYIDQIDVPHSAPAPMREAETKKRKSAGKWDRSIAMDAMRRVVDGEEQMQTVCIRQKIPKDVAFDALSVLLQGAVAQEFGSRNPGSGIPQGLLERLVPPARAGNTGQFSALLVGALDGVSL
jgi:hypothetical protein